MARSRFQLTMGLLPFALIGVTLIAFLVTRDAAVFALAGVLAAVYVLAFFLVLRRRRNRPVGQKRRRGRRPRS